MKRRQALGAVAGLATLAGCSSPDEYTYPGDGVTVREFTLSTDAASLHVETRMYEGLIGWDTETLARIVEADADVSSVLLTRYEDSYDVETDHHLWSVPDEFPGETEVYVAEGDLLEMRVVGADGLHQTTATRVPEMQVPEEGQR